MAAIETNLTSPVTYNAGEELDVIITFTAPQTGTYYLLGGLYDSSYNFISGSMFGIILPTGAVYAINSITETQLWAALSGDVEVLPCKLTLTRTGVLLGLFLMRMTGTVPDLTDDVEEGSVTLILTGGTALVEFDLNALMLALVAVGMMGIIVKAAAE